MDPWVSTALPAAGEGMFRAMARLWRLGSRSASLEVRLVETFVDSRFEVVQNIAVEYRKTQTCLGIVWGSLEWTVRQEKCLL